METFVAYAAVNKAFSAPDLSTANPDHTYSHDDDDDDRNTDKWESDLSAGHDVIDGLGKGYKRLVENSKERSHSFPVSTIEGTKEKRKAKKDHKSRDEVPSYPKEKHRKIICIESTV